MNNEYEAYVLSVGDFDERVFLGSEADEEIGTPTKYREEGTGELAERLQMKANIQQHIDEVSIFSTHTHTQSHSLSPLFSIYHTNVHFIQYRYLSM